MKIQDLLLKFQGVKQVSENQYMAICPAHDDHSPSLSIGLSKDRKQILLNCFAGCKAEDILNNVGLKLKDMYDNDERNETNTMSKTVYTYYNADGSIAYTKNRFDKADGKKSFSFVCPNGEKGLGDKKPVPYNLPEVIRAQKVYFVEGEKCADAVIQAGRVATTLNCGSGSKWLSEYQDYFMGKEVVILPDNDKPGMKYAKKIVENIPNAKIVCLPGLPPKGDVYDWLKAGHSMEEVDDLPYLDILEQDESTELKSEPQKRKSGKNKTQENTLLEILQEQGATLFINSENNEPYIALRQNKHLKVMKIESGEFNTYASYVYREKTQSGLKSENTKQVALYLKGKTLFENSKKVKLYNRVGKAENAFWYDLRTEDWKFVKITEEGWEIREEDKILFDRYNHQKGQCLPRKNGDIQKILKYINIKNQKTLFLCWFVSCYVPDIVHSAIIVFGEKGAAKTTACTFLKKAIDPSIVKTLSLDKKTESRLISLQEHWFLPFDNLSKINQDTSDLFCRAITGEAVQSRKLYTDDESHFFLFKRCLAINGINNVANSSDLLDRSILLELSRVDEEDRRELTELEQEFEEDLPDILGGVFDVLSKAMRIYPDVHLRKLPRMADFCRWGYAIGEALGGQGEKFLSEYNANREKSNYELISSDSVATLMIDFMENKREWKGLVSELWNYLRTAADETGLGLRAVPPAANALSRKLNELHSNLKNVGIEFTIKSTAKGSLITIENEKISQLPPYIQEDKEDQDEEVEF